MSGAVVSFTALRTARMLKENAPAPQIAAFIGQMMLAARSRGDLPREAFWRDVAALVKADSRLGRTAPGLAGKPRDSALASVR